MVETGHRCLSKLLVEALRVDRGEARRLIRDAALLVAPEPGLFDGSAPEPVLPATAVVAADGGLGAGHVEVIHTTVDRLQAVSPSLPVGVVEEVERQLADLADLTDPAADQLDGQPVDEPANENVGENAGENADEESDSATAGSADAEAGVAPEASRPSRDRLSRETTVIVTVDLDTLTGDRDPTSASTRGWQGLGLLDGLHALSPAAARRLACDAAIIPAVMGSRGEPLDLGRKTRVTAQRRAVIARDRHCAHPGCRRSPRRCDVHHVIPWYRYGPTDVGNLVLLCAYHHHQHHHSDWHIQMIDGVSVFIPPAWLDPLQAPRSNRTHTAAA